MAKKELCDSMVQFTNEMKVTGASNEIPETIPYSKLLNDFSCVLECKKNKEDSNMKLALKSKEVTQHKMEFEVNGRSVSITLTKNCASSWIFAINKGTNLTVEELIGICKSIYDSKVIDKNDVIIIYDADDNATYIRDSEQVENAIQSSFIISSFINQHRG